MHILQLAILENEIVSLATSTLSMSRVSNALSETYKGPFHLRCSLRRLKVLK